MSCNGSERQNTVFWPVRMRNRIVQRAVATDYSAFHGCSRGRQIRLDETAVILNDAGHKLCALHRL
jgi:hypothetical protein